MVKLELHFIAQTHNISDEIEIPDISYNIFCPKCSHIIRCDTGIWKHYNERPNCLCMCNQIIIMMYNKIQSRITNINTSPSDYKFPDMKKEMP